MSQPDSAPQPERDPRVYLAAERTLLAWVRTGLALMGFGFVVARFGMFLNELAAVRGNAAPDITPSPVSQWIGIALVIGGVLVNILAGIDHVRTIRAFRRGDTEPSTRSGLAVALAAVLALLGLVLAVYLMLPR